MNNKWTRRATEALLWVVKNPVKNPDKNTIKSVSYIQTNEGFQFDVSELKIGRITMVELDKMLDRLGKHREWVCTDDDSLQYQHRISNDEYVMIQLMWLDIIKEESEYEEGIVKDYIVVGDVVDLKDEDFELTISGYYDSLDAMKEIYGLEIEDLKPLIAECAFEQQSNWWYVSDLMTREAAEHLIKMYINA